MAFNLYFGGKKNRENKPEAADGLTAVDNLTTFAKGVASVKDLIAPAAIEVDFDFVKIGQSYFRTLFIVGYPRFVGANWLSPLINFDHSLDIAMYYYPTEAHGVLDDLRRKITEMEATIDEDMKKGRITDAVVKAALEDARALQEQLVKGVERFFQFSFYITVSAKTIEELNEVTKRVEATLGSLMVLSKHATLQMEEAFKTTIPACQDKLYVIRNMDTTSLATTFPFTSSELTSNEGILYGINEHNGSLIIFDRFTRENYNSVIFAKSGSGKSYVVKLESLRYLLFGTEIIVIDPEAEYKKLAEALGGEFISFSASEPAKINPFDLSGIYEEGENELGLKILSLHTLFKIVLGNITNSEEAVLDRALIATYKLKGITPDPTTQRNEPPILEDLYKVLLGMEEPEASGLADRLERYVKGSLAGIFDQRSNLDIKNTFTVFSTRDLEDQLRPVAMYIILDFIWTKIKRDRRRRLLVVDEAWYLMKHPDSATFLYSIAKRARKYYLGLTTITQDVEDFLSSDYGKAIVTNSSIQILLKQHPAAIDRVAEVFYLSEGEKRLLLACNVGEGLFFAGPNHVAIQVVASPEEHVLITTKPQELQKMAEEEKKEAEKKAAEAATQVPPPVVTPVPISPPSNPTPMVPSEPTPVVSASTPVEPSGSPLVPSDALPEAPVNPPPTS